MNRLADALAMHLARRVLQRWPAQGKILLLPIVSERDHRTLDGLHQLSQLLREYSQTELTEVLERQFASAFSQLAGIAKFASPISSLVAALRLQLPNGNGQSAGVEFSILWNLSGLMCATGFWDSAAGSAWPKGIPVDDKAMREVLRGCIMASGVDPAQLQKELEDCLRHGDSTTSIGIDRFVYERMRRVDIAINWKAAIGLDIEALEMALHHGSGWIVTAAVNLIAINANQEAISRIASRVLREGKDEALWAATALTSILPESDGTELLLARLEAKFVDGIMYLYERLAKLNKPLDERLMKAVRKGLLTYGPRTAESATKIAAKHLGDPRITKLLEEAFDLWSTREEPYPKGGGVVPPSPREGILKALLLSKFDRTKLIVYISDPRSDVASVARDALVAALKSGEMRAVFVEAVRTDRVPVDLLTRVLREDISFSEHEVAELCRLLTHADVSVRRTAISILSEKHLKPASILERAALLLEDSDPEIRERAARLMAHYRS